MKIAGLQKLTLLDFPGKVACTVFTPGCNFVCPFCQNSRLVLTPGEQDLMDIEGFFSFLSKRVGILDGVAVTGGEPLLQKDIDEFFRRVKDMGFGTKLDTNGSMPGTLQYLVSEKLVDYVAVDIKNSQKKYAETSGCSAYMLEKVKDTVEFLKLGTVPYEFRTTVVNEFHKAEDFVEIGEWIEGADNYFLQKFEDSGEIIENGLHCASAEDMNSFLEIVKPYVKNVSLRGM